MSLPPPGGGRIHHQTRPTSSMEMRLIGCLGRALPTPKPCSAINTLTRPMGNLLADRMGHSLAAMGGRLFLFGGVLADGSTKSAELFVLDPAASAPAWQDLSMACSGSVPSARALHAAAVLNSKLFICFGRSVDSPQAGNFFLLSTVANLKSVKEVKCQLCFKVRGMS
jgi:hypothetical protein